MKLIIFIIGTIAAVAADVSHLGGVSNRYVPAAVQQHYAAIAAPAFHSRATAFPASGPEFPDPAESHYQADFPVLVSGAHIGAISAQHKTAHAGHSAAGFGGFAGHATQAAGYQYGAAVTRQRNLS